MNPRVRRLGMATMLVLLPVSLLVAQTERSWIYIEVTQGDETTVNINLPLAAVEAALEAAPDEIILGGRARLPRSAREISIPALRRLWQELRDVGDTEFASVQDDDRTVTVARSGDYIRVDVESASAEAEQVHVQLPASLVDALLSGDGESVTLRAALEELSRERDEMVRVDRGDSRVRIWVDEAQEAVNGRRGNAVG